MQGTASTTTTQLRTAHAAVADLLIAVRAETDTIGRGKPRPPHSSGRVCLSDKKTWFQVIGSLVGLAVLCRLLLELDTIPPLAIAGLFFIAAAWCPVAIISGPRTANYFLKLVAIIPGIAAVIVAVWTLLEWL